MIKYRSNNIVDNNNNRLIVMRSKEKHNKQILNKT